MKVQVTQIAGQRFEVHTDGATLTVDVPTAQGGQPGGFSSGELLLGALGACMLGTLVEAEALQGTQLEGVAVELVAEAAAKPQRIGSIDVHLELPAGLPPQQQDRYTRSPSRCKIHNTLHQPPTITMHTSTANTARIAHS
ncbi:OsmC family protein [Leekyejoonella antrihumi]|nr:OsmC family protein [Leekyejoonella antrihumi]